MQELQQQGGWGKQKIQNLKIQNRKLAKTQKKKI